MRRCLLRNGYSGKDPQQLASLLLLSRAQLVKLVQVRLPAPITQAVTHTRARMLACASCSWSICAAGQAGAGAPAATQHLCTQTPAHAFTHMCMCTMADGQAGAPGQDGAGASASHTHTVNLLACILACLLLLKAYSPTPAAHPQHTHTVCANVCRHARCLLAHRLLPTGWAHTWPSTYRHLGLVVVLISSAWHNVCHGIICTSIASSCSGLLACTLLSSPRFSHCVHATGCVGALVRRLALRFLPIIQCVSESIKHARV